MKFQEFLTKKRLEEEESMRISSNLLKNLIDILRVYVMTEYELSEDEKDQIVDNMKVSLGQHSKGALGKGPRFVATSFYNESEGQTTPVEITIEVITEKIGKGTAIETPVEKPEIDDISDKEEKEEE